MKIVISAHPIRNVSGIGRLDRDFHIILWKLKPYGLMLLQLFHARRHKD
jgi:hypothetical protein